MSSVQGASSAANAIQQWQYLQSLSTASAGASQPKKADSASAFDPFAGLGGATQAPASSGPVPPFNLDNMSALINAQAQSSGTGTNGLSRHQQKVFGQLDTDGDGKVTGAELQKDFGADNKAIADFVMKKLDSDGDGAISQSEFAAGTTRGGGHHHMHAGAPQGQDALAALLGTTQGASERRLFYFCRSKIFFALKWFGAIGAFAAVAVTLALEPVARIVASPRTAGETWRAFGRLWRALPAVLAQRRK